MCQGEKTRLIDDMRPVNQTVSTFESPRPHTVDVLAAMGRELMSACPGVPIQGKAFDLTAAYRQLPLHPDAAWVSFISIWDCERKEPALFRLKALPFGASKSECLQFLEDFSLLVVVGVQGFVHCVDLVLR